MPGDPLEIHLPSELHEEQHYSPDQIGKLWGLHRDVIRKMFCAEPGVLVLKRAATREKRGYTTLRIPKSVMERVHQRMRVEA